MTNPHTIRLVGKTQRDYACQCVQRAPDGHVVVIREETRRDAQNRLMWALIRDLREQVEGHAQFTPEQTKLRFLNYLDNEMQMLPQIEGGGMFVVGQRSSTLSKSLFSDLIELMFMHGAKNDVRWSRKALDTIEEVLGPRGEQQAA